VDLDLTRAEAQIDVLIERRAYEAEAAERDARAWAESAERYDLQKRREKRLALAAYHRHLISVFEAQAQHHRAELGRLIDEAAG